MPRNHDMERRLQNWARWRIGITSGGLGFASPKLEERVDGQDAPRVPTVDHEADETDQGVRVMESRLRATLEAVYIGSGTIKSKAQRLCCSESTVYARVDEAHRVLAGWLADRAACARAERQRVEKLQRGAVMPKGGSFPP